MLGLEKVADMFDDIHRDNLAKVRQVTGRPVPPGLTPARTYRAKSGDTLSIIAGVMYKDPQRWRQIYDANPATWGPDPTKAKILVGQVLTIP